MKRLSDFASALRGKSSVHLPEMHRTLKLRAAGYVPQNQCRRHVLKIARRFNAGLAWEILIASR